MEQLLTLGPYPALNVNKARNLHLKAMLKVIGGEDPAERKQSRKRPAAYDLVGTFGDLAKN